jgi:ankyrin repeat protein
MRDAKRANSYDKDQNSSSEEYEYVSSERDSEQNFQGNRVTDSGQLRSTSNLRSTLPLNPFYGEFIEYIKSRNNRKIKEVLEEFPHRFYSSVDEMDKTILHCACEKNSFEIVKIIIEQLFEGQEMVISNRPNMRNTNKMTFINQQNKDGLTAIHYASFRGNIPIIQYLIDNGGNPYIKDNDGHNVIHIAAQGDKVNVIYYFIKNFNFDVNDRDNKESSALHWSAYLNKEISLTYLIAWGANVNAQDAEQNTPLHLAVLTAERVQETRCTKILLLKGA